MYLLIDNSAEDGAFFYYTEQSRWNKRKFSLKQRGQKCLLACLDKLLNETNKKLSDIRGIVVLLGKGKFTATRIAVTVANTLAYSLKIPIIGAKELDWGRLYKKIKTAKRGLYVSAKYSAKANVGNKKKK